MNRKSRTTIFGSASLLLHVISILLVVHFLNPQSQHPVDDAVSLQFFDINKPRAARTPTTKRVDLIRTKMGGSSAQPNLALRPIQQAIPTSHNQLPVVDIGEANIGLGHGVGTGDGDGLNEGSFLAEPVERSAPVPVQTRKVSQTGGEVLPPKRTEMNRSIEPLGTDISHTQPIEDLTNPTDLLILGFISESRSQSQPPTDAQFLIAGLQHAESLIVSGKGEVHFQMVRNKRSEGATFAFNKKKVYMAYQLGSLKGHQCIYNGKVELGIDQDPDNPNEIGGIILVDRKTIIAQEDPRNWGIQFDELPLSLHFQKHGVHIVGSEVFKKEPCYVVESAWNGKPIKFWISINGGFRCLKIQYEADWQGPGTPKAIPSTVTFEIQYKVYQTQGKKAWFPLKGKRTARAKSDNKFLGKVILTVKNFQLNVDVSDLFRVKVDPEFPVWIENLEKRVPFKDIGWKP